MHQNSPSILLLALGLSTVVASGCTQLDRWGQEQRSKNLLSTPSASPTVPITPGVDRKVEIQPIPTQSLADSQQLSDPAPLNLDEIESVLDELESSLLALDSLLGSTGQWDVIVP